MFMNTLFGSTSLVTHIQIGFQDHTFTHHSITKFLLASGFDSPPNQAAEVGMVPAAAIRNVLNSALRRSGSLLELPAPPLFPSDLSALRLNVYPDSFVDDDDFPHPAIGEPRGDGLEDILTAFSAGFKDDRAPDEDEESEGGFDDGEAGEAGEGEEEYVDEEMDWDELSSGQKARLFRMEPELWEEDDSAVRQAYDEAVSILNAATVKEHNANVTGGFSMTFLMPVSL